MIPQTPIGQFLPIFVRIFLILKSWQITTVQPGSIPSHLQFLNLRRASVVEWLLDILIGQSSLSPVKSTVKSWIDMLNEGQNLGFI